MSVPYTSSSLATISEYGTHYESPSYGIASSSSAAVPSSFAAGTSSTHAFARSSSSSTASMNGNNGTYARNHEGTRAPSALLQQNARTIASRSDDDYGALSSSLTNTTATPSSGICRHTLPRSDKSVSELWASVQVPDSVPYFGGFLTLLTTSRSPPLSLRWNVEPPRLSQDGSALPLVIHWPPNLRGPHDTPFLKMSMNSWPTLATCVNCPWRERLFKRRSFAGFFVRANIVSFTDVINHDNITHGEIATSWPIDTSRAGATSLSMSSLCINNEPSSPLSTTMTDDGYHNGINDSKTVASASTSTMSSTSCTPSTNGGNRGGITVRRNNMYMFYASDDTRLGSLYYTLAGSLIQYRMPLDTITAVYIGSQGNFWPNVMPTGLQIRDECFTLQSSNGVALHLSCGSQIQRRLWLRRMWHLQVKGGRTCTSAAAAPVPIPYTPPVPPATAPIAAAVPASSSSSSSIESVTSPRHHLADASSVPSSLSSSHGSVFKLSSRANGYSYDHPSIARTEGNIILPIADGQPVIPSSPTSPSCIAPSPLSSSSSSIPTAVATPIRFSSASYPTMSSSAPSSSSYASALSQAAYQQQQHHVQSHAPLHRPAHYRASSMPSLPTISQSISLSSLSGATPSGQPHFTRATSSIPPAASYASPRVPSVPATPLPVAPALPLQTQSPVLRIN